MTHRPVFPDTRRAQSGLSLVELMVGITVGLFVVAAAAALVSNQLGDNRRLLLETQVQQDLRATMDIITRQLRRAGAALPATVEAGIAASPVAGGASNPFAAMTPAGPASASETGFSFYFDAAQQGPYGFKLEGGVLKTLIPRVTLPGGTWQELTDTNTLVVDAFSITPQVVSSTELPCPKLCADGTMNCWPKLVVRNYVVEIQAHAKSDAGVARGLRNEVRIRNDMVQFPAGFAGCPV
jgi:type IV pilus assembly protein PilW